MRIHFELETEWLVKVNANIFSIKNSNKYLL